MELVELLRPCRGEDPRCACLIPDRSALTPLSSDTPGETPTLATRAIRNQAGTRQHEPDEPGAKSLRRWHQLTRDGTCRTAQPVSPASVMGPLLRQ
jgi:hypothetical protein